VTLALTATAAEILSVPLDIPERAFENDLDAAQARYRALLKVWHPDKNPAGGDVAAHLNRLHDAAVVKIKARTWTKPGTRLLVRDDGSEFRIRFRRQAFFSLGEMLVADTFLFFLIRNDYADLFEQARRMIAGLRFDSAADKKAELLLPKWNRHFDTKEGLRFVAIEKTPDVFLLADVYSTGKLIDRHACWVISRLLYIACYLQDHDICHNGICDEAVLVSPKHHSALLLGGWWHAVKAGDKLISLPAQAHRLAPPDMLRTKRADHRLDLIMIRALGRQLFAGAAPQPITEFLRDATSGNAREDIDLWYAATKNSFGARRFVELSITDSDIYAGI
jgi:hypothetical protein